MSDLPTKRTRRDRRGDSRRRWIRPASYVVASPTTGLPPETAKTADLSSGGLCITTRLVLKPADLVRLELPLSRTSVQIPTLTQVRWIQPLPADRGFRVGLQFIL